jgi:hypothetical protein
MTMPDRGIGARSPISVSLITALFRPVVHPFASAGVLFSSRLKKALVMKAKHGQAFTSLNATFPTAVVEKWAKMVSDWDKDKKKKNPYEEPVAG